MHLVVFNGLSEHTYTFHSLFFPTYFVQFRSKNASNYVCVVLASTKYASQCFNTNSTFHTRWVTIVITKSFRITKFATYSGTKHRREIPQVYILIIVSYAP
jgi:hypothetical protein